MRAGKKLVVFVFFLLISLIIAIPGIHADLGPKPTVNIAVTYLGQAVPDNQFVAQMLECGSGGESLQAQGFVACIANPEICKAFDALNFSDATCHWRRAFFAWGGNCKDGLCTFSYFPPETFRIAVYLPSQHALYVSNVASRDTSKLNSEFSLDLQQDGSGILRRKLVFWDLGRFVSFIPAFILTVIIELIVALIYLGVRKLPKNILLTIFFANLISLPIVWFVISIIPFNVGYFILVSEMFAVVFEAWFVFWKHPDHFTFKQALGMSVLTNGASFILGNIISVFFLAIPLLPLA